MIKKLIKNWQALRYYVIADPADNSITLSKHLFRHIKNNAPKSSKTSLFVFAIPQCGTYGFMFDHGIEQPTQLCDIQYNEKHKCIGFETLCPSVGAILYHYALPADCRIKLSVSVQKNKWGKTYYQFENPRANESKGGLAQPLPNAAGDACLKPRANESNIDSDMPDTTENQQHQTI